MPDDAPADAAGSVPLVDLAGDNDDAELNHPLGGPVHPDDRLWRHPSELLSSGRPVAVAPSGHGMPARERWLPVFLAGTVGALLTAGIFGATGALDSNILSEPRSQASSSTVALAVHSQPVPAGVAEVAERVRPSLLALAGMGADGHPSRGSAIAIRDDHVLTAARLVLGFDDLEVLVKGAARRATLVGSDVETDLALLAVEGGGLTPVSWGEAADLRTGDPAVAVSSPPAAEPGPTVTSGIVSGINRTLSVGGTELRGLLQVDRPVPSEAAGGALVDPTGALVGITIPAAPSAPFGYAVPANVAKEVARQLLSSGRVARPWLGIEGGDRSMNGGAVVQRVKPASPAAAAGLLEGDVVTEMNGEPMPSMGMLLLGLRLHRPGETIRLIVLRAGRPIEVPVTLAERA